ncbi:hypothetical protein [Cerasicoccus arenae]|uniref:hypothetical protein n=1 Tax=Cerasicoccus arenae TaxID=424488 RepID=UPI0016779656|nr:hypothetical protein [Cerasicoccus arenae]MBK1859167.1 hypothetical protein [Cerasicoccus arenae]
MKISGLLLTASLAFAGCGYNVQYSALNNPITPLNAEDASAVAARGPISPSEVTLFLTQRPQGEYRELGVITIPTYQTVPPQEEIFQLFRDKAAEVGADGVILLDPQMAVDSYTTPNYVYDWGVFYTETVRSRSIFRGMAIQFIQ